MITVPEQFRIKTFTVLQNNINVSSLNKTVTSNLIDAFNKKASDSNGLT